MPKKRLGKNAPVHALLASDSDDENYEERATTRSPRKARPRSKPARKKRRQHSDSDEDDDDIEEISVDSASSAEESEPAPVGPAGRPMRKIVATKQPTYVEASDEDIDSGSDGKDEVEDHDSDDEAHGTRKGAALKRGAAPPRTRIVTLKFGNKVLTQFEAITKQGVSVQSQPVRRSTRAASSGPQHTQTQRATGGKAPVKSAGKMPLKMRGRTGLSQEPSRRSTRLTHAEEPLAALSNSGHHMILTGTANALPLGIEEERDSQLSEPKQEPQDDNGESVKENTPPAAQEPVDVEVRENTQPDQDAQQEEAGEEEEAPEQSAQQTVSRDDTGHEADEDDEDIPTRRGRGKITTISRRDSTTSPRATRSTAEPVSVEKPKEPERRLGRRRLGRSTSRKPDGSDEDEYQEEEGGASSDDSMSSGARANKKQAAEGFVVEDDDSDEGPATRSRGKRPTAGKRNRSSEDDAQVTQQELEEELHELNPKKRPRRTIRREPSGNESNFAGERLRRRTNNVDYRVFRPEMAAVLDDRDGGTSTPRGRKNGNALAPSRSLFDTNGPFGGTDTIPIFGRHGAQPLDIDSDSSDDDAIRRRASRAGGIGGGIGMTPTAAHGPGMLPPVPQTHNVDPMQAGVPANMGRITKPGKNALADADPLGVATDISFDSVGGLDDRIQQLKEMVMLPLMYPEMFKAKGVTPPRGVLFHGPPGTGKTLMARAVASSFTGADGKKVTFFMRKGADCLSKWVGEAERQLRLLFDEARNSQPSIIFFDEIDGLAPVRSSKQEQIHASIVSTLLALMDGMDGRGQVVVIGATNRPDAVDPALRRPGRFDREFYFPLPATEARRKILDIHTTGWEPPLTDTFKDQLAAQTKGYGGADLRALCTEAALNAMQRTYPQIYKSDSKLKVDPSLVTVTAKDFMVSIKKMVPSSERSASSGASPLPEHIRPLLQEQLEVVKETIKTIFPEVKRLTPLEEAEYEDEGDDEDGFSREMMMENFEQARVYRPRLLVHGSQGLGQQYMGAAILHCMEKVHVQAFDLATLMSDATRTPETSVVQLFTEVKRHKPSVIFIPNVDVWYHTLPPTAIATFKGLLNQITPNERVMLFGITETRAEDLDPELLRDLFGYSRRDRFELHKPHDSARYKFFQSAMDNIKRSPREFPQDATNRKKRVLPELERASPPPQSAPTEEDKKAQAMRDRQLKNHLKLRLNNLMENLKQKYRRFKKPAVEQEVLLRGLEQPPPQVDTEMVVSDIPREPVEQRFTTWCDENDVVHVKDNLYGKVYYNMDLDVIEDRFSNGYYSSPRQFLEDLQRIRHDAKEIGEKENKRKANEMLTNAEVYIADVEADTVFLAQCEELHARLQRQAREKKEKEAKEKEEREQASRLFHTSNESNGNYHTAPATTPERSSGPSNGVHPPGSPSQQDGATTPQPSTFNTTHYQNPAAGAGHTSTQMTQMESAHETQIGLAKVGAMSMSMIVNDASTTTSGGKRTSDGTAASQPFSVPYSNSSGSNPALTIDMPVWHEYPAKGDSQLPATQVIHSSSSDPNQSPSQNLYGLQAFSQPPGPPPTQAPRLLTIPAPPLPDLIATPQTMTDLHNRLTQGTNGFNVEQLEQVNAMIMDNVWKTKSFWNRDEVARRIEAQFDETRKDIVEMWGVERETGSSFGA